MGNLISILVGVLWARIPGKRVRPSIFPEMSVIRAKNNFTRAQVLCVLQPLVPDLQEKIFKLIFPSSDQSVNTFKSLCRNPKDWDDLVFDLAQFAHSDHQLFLLDMKPIQFTYIRHSCNELGLKCKTADTDENYLALPSQWGWDRQVMIEKPPGWTFNFEDPDYNSPKLQRRNFVCLGCNGEMAFIPEGEFQYYYNGRCYGCLFKEPRQWWTMQAPRYLFVLMNTVWSKLLPIDRDSAFWQLTSLD